MDLLEQYQMDSQQELNHWWIKTRWLYIDKALSSLKTSSTKLNVLEAGCGTAQNLYYLRRLARDKQKISQLVGYDPLLNSTHQSLWDSQDDYMTNHLSRLSLEKFDLMLAMDVLEHIEDDVSALEQWLPYMKKDGSILITVPAFQQLWSDKDVTLGHKRRYTRKTLLSVTNKVGLEPVYLNYAFSYLYLPMRLLKYWTFKKNDPYSLKPTNACMNHVLYYLGIIEKALRGNPWFGSSLIGVFKLK